MGPAFDVDEDLDWALGELLELFERANRLGIYPHELDPLLFRNAWYVLNAQPFEVRSRCHQLLMQKITRPLQHLNREPGARKLRYAYVLTQ